MIDKMVRNCINCYWHDGKYCEKHINMGDYGFGRDCIYYLDDELHHRLMMNRIYNDKEWVVNHYFLLDNVDKQKFREIYGDDLI